MDRKKIQIIGILLVVGLAIAGLNFIPDSQKVVKVKKQPIDRSDGMPNFSVGVQPDVPVTRTLVGVRNGVDEYIEKALEVIEGK